MVTTPGTIASDASAADWLTAWATVGYTVAAIVAGIFAWRAWTATKRSLDTAQQSLLIEQERRAEERTERAARARAEASRFHVRLSTEDSADGSLEIIAENKAAVPFEGIELIVAYWDDELGNFIAYGNSPAYQDAINPHSDDVMRIGPLPPGPPLVLGAVLLRHRGPSMAQA